MVYQTAVSARLGQGCLVSVLGDVAVLVISKSFENLVWAFWHGLWILRKCTWKFSELLRTRFQNWCLTLPCCTGHGKTQSGPDSREGETQFNSWYKHGKGSVLSGHLCRQPTHSATTLSKALLLPSWEPVPLSHGATVQCGEFLSKDFKLDSWILSLALPLAHCQILVKLLNVVGHKCSF